MSELPNKAEGGDTDRTRRALIANLRHELRTPLNAVIGYSEMLLEDLTDSENLCADLRKIHSAGSQLLTLVNDTLDPARKSLGANLRHELRTPIKAVIEHSERLQEEAEALGQEEVVPDLQRIHSAAERFLSMIDEVANLSRLETGSETSSQTSSHLPEEAAGAATIAWNAEGSPKDAGVRTEQNPLLIVDDNDANRDVLARYLGRQGYGTAAAENGRRALQMARTQKFDLVLLDVMMPETNGYEVLRHLKSDPSLRDIPVIMISALDEIESVVRCIEMGAEDYLPKPFDPVLLRARIGACLEKKRLRDQEIEYLRNVNYVTAAAAAVEAGELEPETLEQVAARRDELGRLARVFQRMAREVHAREKRLKQEVQQLRIEIDETRTARQVADITETDYFRDLQRKADQLRFRAEP